MIEEVMCICVQIPLSMATALTVRVGNELGSGNPRSAKRASYIGCGIHCEWPIIDASHLCV